MGKARQFPALFQPSTHLTPATFLSTSTPTPHAPAARSLQGKQLPLFYLSQPTHGEALAILGGTLPTVVAPYMLWLHST